MCAFQLYVPTPAIVRRPSPCRCLPSPHTTASLTKAALWRHGHIWQSVLSSARLPPSHTMADQLHHNHRSLSTIAFVFRSPRPIPDHGWQTSSSQQAKGITRLVTSLNHSSLPQTPLPGLRGIMQLLNTALFEYTHPMTRSMVIFDWVARSGAVRRNHNRAQKCHRTTTSQQHQHHHRTRRIPTRDNTCVY